MGDPHFELAGFSLWVHDLDAQGWFDVTARFLSNTTTICISGHFVLFSDLKLALPDLDRLYETLQGTAVLESTEPGFRVELKAETGGHLSLALVMTPGFWEEYRYDEQIDQSYLPTAIAQLRAILQKYA